MSDDKFSEAARPGWYPTRYKRGPMVMDIRSDDLSVNLSIGRTRCQVHIGECRNEVESVPMTPTDLREVAAQLVAVADAMDGVAPRNNGGYVCRAADGREYVDVIPSGAQHQPVTWRVVERGPWKTPSPPEEVDCPRCCGAGSAEDDCGSSVECEECWGHGTVLKEQES